MGEVNPSNITDVDFRARYVKPKPGRALIVGSKVWHGGRTDTRKFYKDAMGIDLLEGEGVDLVWNLETAPVGGNNSPDKFAHVECCSVLEHSAKPWEMAKNIITNLEPGGTLLISAPTVWRYHPYTDDYWRFTSSGIKALFPDISWKVMKYVEHHLFKQCDVPKIPHREGRYDKVQILAFGCLA